MAVPSVVLVYQGRYQPARGSSPGPVSSSRKGNIELPYQPQIAGDIEVSRLGNTDPHHDDPL